MTRGFYTILAAQFFSALADNALLFAAIALLAQIKAPEWQTPVLQQFFVFAYIVLAPFVGPFADSLPKGRVMFISNAVKFTGCLAMLLGLHPLYAYGIVGIGAAMYSPAKYGILTEYLPPHQLVKANGWMEGLTVGAIILGAILGGMMVGPHLAPWVFNHVGIPSYASWVDTAAEIAMVLILVLYVIAAAVNLYIPRVAIDHKLPRKTPLYILHDFWHSFRLLWRDPLGQVSLAVTTLFWGAGVTLRLIVLTWAEVALKFDLEKATQLTAVTAVGIGIGSVLAARFVSLQRAVKVLPVGIMMGVAVMSMMFITSWQGAIAHAHADRRDGWLLRRPDERPAAAPRSPADGRRSLDRGAELQREHQHPGLAGRVRPDAADRFGDQRHHRLVRPAGRRHHVPAVADPRARSG